MNASKKFTPILKGVEVDILADGSLDFDDDFLSRFDFVVASVHSRFSMSEPDMTARIIRALENPYVDILGHLSGRLLLTREPYALDLDAVVETAIRLGKVVEINCNPRRLELDWRHCRRYHDKGLISSINPDAHQIEGYQYMELGTGIARKGWLSKLQILNTFTLKKLTGFFQKRRAAAL